MKRILRIIISLVLVILSGAGGVLFVWPRYQEFATLRQEVRQHQDRIERGQQALEALQERREQVEARSEEFTTSRLAIPADPGVPALFDHLQQLAASSGLVLQEMGNSEEQDPERKLRTIALQLELTGSYEGLKNFLDAARRSTRILNVRSLEVETSGGSAVGVLEISVTLLAYAKADPAPEDASETL